MNARNTLLGMASAVEQFRRYQPDAPVSRVIVFLTVALKPGITMREVEKGLKVSQTTMSRHVAILGTAGFRDPMTGKRERGWGLLEAMRDPEDYRQKRLWLRPKGRKLAKQMAARLL